MSRSSFWVDFAFYLALIVLTLGAIGMCMHVGGSVWGLLLIVPVVQLGAALEDAGKDVPKGEISSEVPLMIVAGGLFLAVALMVLCILKDIDISFLFQSYPQLH